MRNIISKHCAILLRFLIIISFIFINHLHISAAQKAFKTEIKPFKGGIYIAAAPAMVEAIIRNISEKEQKIAAQEGIWFMGGKKCGVEEIADLPAPLNKN